MSMEMSRPLKKRLNAYLDGLKQDEIRLAECLEKTGGKMVNVYGMEGDKNDTTN